MITKSIVCGLLCTFVALSAELVDGKWPQFRGPGGLGIGNDKISLPSEFGPTKALLWKTDLPLGHGSPCIWGDRIFVTAFNSGAKKPEVIAVNRKDGKIAWRQTIPSKEVETVHEGSSPATSTPVTDGERVYAYSGSYGNIAYDCNGQRAWEYQIGLAKSPHRSSTAAVVKLQPFSEALQKYDIDKDGKLSAAEAPANDLFFLKRVGVPDNVPGAHFNIKLFFRAIDSNQDGFVDETEYNAVSQFAMG